MYLNFFFYKLLCMVNLLWGPPDSEKLKIWITVWWRLMGHLHESTSLLVDGLDIFSSSANNKPTFVCRNGEGHFSSPAALAPTMSLTSRWHSRTTTWGPLWRHFTLILSIWLQCPRLEVYLRMNTC